MIRAVDADNINLDNRTRSALLKPLASSLYLAHSKSDHTSTAYRLSMTYIKLRKYRHYLAGTAEFVNDEELRTHIYTTTPEEFKMTVRILLRRTPTPSVEEVMDAIREDADIDALTMEIGEASTGSALYASSRVRGRGQPRGCG